MPCRASGDEGIGLVSKTAVEIAGDDGIDDLVLARTAEDDVAAGKRINLVVAVTEEKQVVASGALNLVLACGADVDLDVARVSGAVADIIITAAQGNVLLALRDAHMHAVENLGGGGAPAPPGELRERLGAVLASGQKRPQVCVRLVRLLKKDAEQLQQIDRL